MERESEKIVIANLEELTYSGRIDFTNSLEPIFIFPASSVSMCFTGVSLKILVKNNHSYYINYIGYIIDGVEKKVLLSNDSSLQEITLVSDLRGDKFHEVIVFKRQDACHEFTFYGFNVSKDSKIIKHSKKPRKCIEFYGDSAATGELIEDVDYVIKQNLNYNGEYSNAWHSYAMVTARNLKAQVSIIAQGGISLLDDSGYFHETECIGMESIYDKLHFNPDIGDITNWDFRGYTPQVVVIDIGQNDAVPRDYMKEDDKGEKAKKWSEHYREFVLNIRRCYPNAFIVLTTTIMNHHSSWDRAIGIICLKINDVKIQHFLYSCNGRGTPLCIRIPEAEQMAFELSIFLKSFGPEIWN
ncbi:MAG: electron transporter RnfD [Clostridium sp.]|uniref:electron transporter RnfD n=1 Tax=Clostridium sp. TaxID=1506 RepID=UPI003D6D1B97